jgi:hypothetical protein
MKPYEQVKICFIKWSMDDVITTSASTDPYADEKMWEGIQ